MNRNDVGRDDFTEDNTKGFRDGRAVRGDKRERSDKFHQPGQQNPPHDESCDPELRDERCRNNADPRALPDKASWDAGGKSGPGFSDEDLQRFRGMAIRPLGRVFREIAKEFEMYLELGSAYKNGPRALNSLKKMSAWMERRRLDGKYPDHLPVSLTSLHNMVVDVQIFFRTHFGLKAMPLLLSSVGEGFGATGLTEIGKVVWELIREHLESMGYDDLKDRFGSS